MDWSALEHNPFLSGGILLMILGGAAYHLKRLPGVLYGFVERFFILKMEILDDDESFQWLQLWLAQRLQKTLSVSVVTKRPQACGEEWAASDVVCSKPSIYFVPAVGTYFFWFGGRLVALRRDRRENSPARIMAAAAHDSASLSRDRESYSLRFFSRDKNLARQLIETCRDHALPSDGKIDIRVCNYGNWALGTRIQPRPLESVVLDGNQAVELLTDMRQFLTRQDWYRDVGVPYRRGYLLHGPPGNGKTSVVKALASALGMDIYLLALSDPDVNDSRITALMAAVPEKNILLVEDVDCAFVRRKSDLDRPNRLTLSGLLNALDGVAAPEGRIVVMTTNHLEKLDAALIRPGRTDVKVHFGNATTDQALRLFERFCPGHRDLAPVFAEQAGGGRHSMATLQEYLAAHHHDPEGAIRQADALGAQASQEAATAPRKRRKPKTRKPFTVAGI
jgi:mitochondrial chaperone BCS1